MISVNIDESISITILEESVNINNSDNILKDLKNTALSNSIKDIIIDFNKVRFIDSSGIAMLVNFVQSLAGSRRKMSIINATENIKNTVKVLNLTKFLNIK